MKFTELDEKAKNNAIYEVYDEVQERICWDFEFEDINNRISEILDQYHCYEKEIRFEYNYGRVYFPTIETDFEVEELLKDRQDLKELLEELEEQSDGYSSLYFAFSSSKTEVSYFVDYSSRKDVEEMWEFVKKYADEFELDIKNIEISLMFGGDPYRHQTEIVDLFKEVMQKNGDKIAEYLLPKVEEMREKIVEAIERPLKYLESYEYVGDYLREFPDEFEFDEEGNRLKENIDVVA